MAGGHVRLAIVLAFGAGALGGPDALRLLLQFAGRSPAVDVAICVVVISLVTAPMLGTMLLARFVRKPRAGGGGGAPATDPFAQTTAAVSVGAAFLVTACLLAVPGGGLGAIRLPIDFAVNNPIIVAVLAICVAFAAAAGGSLPCTVPLRLRARFFRGAGSVGGPAPAAPARMIKIVFLVAVSVVAASFVALSDGFDAHAQLLFPGFHWRRRMVTMPAAVAITIVTVAGTALRLRCARRVRNAAGAGGGAAARTS